MRICAALLFLTCTNVLGGPVFFDDFESGMSMWAPLSIEHAGIVDESPGGNQVLQLTPRPGEFSHVILNAGTPASHVRMEGRFLFPTDGDGYLGFIYNHQKGTERTDSGVIYVKSNGSYVRVSPHYDGNPSWRLYEEMKIPLEGNRKIQPGTWYDFRLDVHGRTALLFIGDLTNPVVSFDEAPNSSGSLGLEARPGRGDPVWVDDIRITALEATANPETKLLPTSRLNGWQSQAAIEDPQDAALKPPELDPSKWLDLSPDTRGAIITGQLTQYVSGERSVVYLRAGFEADAGQKVASLAISAANRVDVWMNGYYRGSVAPERYIWADHIDSPAHFGARLPLLPSEGRNEMTFRVYGRNFAGGGFYADIVFP
jgi:hypothetical protein